MSMTFMELCRKKGWRFTPAECEEIEEGIYRLKSELETLNTPFYLEEGTLEFLLWYLENTPEEFLEEDPIVEVLRILTKKIGEGLLRLKPHGIRLHK